jgi:molybdopterin-containing oxidoreductase family iron-sulfur binding subunit
MRYVLVIDVSKCIGCRACAVACKSNNNLPDGIWYNRVLSTGANIDADYLADGGIAAVASNSDLVSGSGAKLDIAQGSYPDNLALGYLPAACQHCELPFCVPVCSAGATWKESNGVVVIDNEICIGCQSCIAACPYGARSFNDGEPKFQTGFALGDADAPTHKANTTEKCGFCLNRVERGEVPACMELCLGRCRFWGDIEDPASEVSKYLESAQQAGKETFYLMEDKGTGPGTVYVR